MHSLLKLTPTTPVPAFTISELLANVDNLRAWKSSSGGARAHLPARPGQAGAKREDGIAPDPGQQIKSQARHKGESGKG